MSEAFTVDWKAMSEASGGFPPASFDFVREGLQHTVGRIHGATGSALVDDGGGDDFDDAGDESRHVSGADLCLGLRELALRRYGLLARTVLHRWNIRETADFGRIVFAMIEAGLLRKTEEDSFDDFVGVFDFDEAFDPAETA
ncbi:MAG: Minf_1886 family protein [Planctomycetota bacterium]